MLGRHPTVSWELPISGVVHLLVFGAIIAAQWLKPEGQSFKEPEVIEVAMIGSNVQKSPITQTAMRTPDPVRGSQDAPPPDNVNPNQMTMESPDAKTAGQKETSSREEALAAMKREQALRDLDAPLGNVDRMATSPDGVDNPDGGSSRLGINDPETAAWIKAAEAALNKNFHPLPAHCAANRSLTAIGVASVSPSGTIGQEVRIKTSSGNSSFDASCLRAFSATGQLPPPPAKFASGLTPQLNCKCPT